MGALGSTITTIFLLKFGQVNTLNPQADKVTAQILRSWGTGCKPEACNWYWCTAKYLLQHNWSLDLSEGVYRCPWYKIAQIEVAPESSKDGHCCVARAWASTSGTPLFTSFSCPTVYHPVYSQFWQQIRSPTTFSSPWQTWITPLYLPASHRKMKTHEECLESLTALEISATVSYISFRRIWKAVVPEVRVMKG